MYKTILVKVLSTTTTRYNSLKQQWKYSSIFRFLLPEYFSAKEFIHNGVIDRT